MTGLIIDKEQTRTIFEAALASDKHAYGDFFLFRLLGLQLEYADEKVSLQFRVYSFMLNPQGTLHGGLVATVLDIACGHLLRYFSGGPAVTVEQKIQYIAAIRSGKVHCTAQFLKRGRSIAFIEAQMRDESGQLIAAASSTWKQVQG